MALVRPKPIWVSRRQFLGACMGGGLAALFWDLPALAPRVAAASSPDPSDSLIQFLGSRLREGAFSSVLLTQAFLQRIDALNPSLGAVLQKNPDAEAIAAARDAELARGAMRGPLHGIPVMIKDNIGTLDGMATTAGSLALMGSRLSADSVVASRLRAAGAIILGKANLSEWANFRGAASVSGWSARGGFTRNPYNLSLDPGGSSTGSCVAVAATLAAAAVGTATVGSILAPAAANLVVGLKPTLGLISQEGIIPIARTQDTAGPIATSVTDAAILLGVLQSPWGAAAEQALPQEYTQFLERGALAGTRIGIDQRYFSPAYGMNSGDLAHLRAAVLAMLARGANFVVVDTGDPHAYGTALSTVLLEEFKSGINAYLAGLSDTPVRNLAELIAFNRAHCHAEMKYFGQEIFELAEASSGDLGARSYADARQLCDNLTRVSGLDAVLEAYQLDAIIAPGGTMAAVLPAVAGYPSLSLPIGIDADQRPVALWFYGRAFSEPRLLALAFDLEQELNVRRLPQFVNSPPPVPPDAGLCGESAATQIGRMPAGGLSLSQLVLGRR